ncbi:hypothetical protein QTN25_000463 [Entamoeba marina]
MQNSCFLNSSPSYSPILNLNHYLMDYSHSTPRTYQILPFSPLYVSCSPLNDPNRLTPVNLSISGINSISPTDKLQRVQQWVSTDSPDIIYPHPISLD